MPATPNLFFLLLVSALLTAVVTLSLAYGLFRLLVLPKLKQQLEAELLPQFQARVEAGMTEAAVALLPSLREQVRKGVNDAVHDTITGKVVEDAASTAVKNSFNSIFRRKNKSSE